MKFSIITIFPELIRNFLNYGLLEKAIQNGLVQVDIHDLREFSRNKHRKVDDRPLRRRAGHGADARPAVPRRRARQEPARRGRVILFSAYGRMLKQKKVKELAAVEHLILICGRYEGVDQRAIDALVDEEISLGEYVLMGGEIAAEALLESVSRMIPGVVGNPESVQADSFYQRGPVRLSAVHAAARLPRPGRSRTLLLSGNHKEIEALAAARTEKQGERKMKKIVECVPNFSEGRDMAVIDQITRRDQKNSRRRTARRRSRAATPTARWSPSPAARTRSRKRLSRPSKRPPN